MAPDPIEPNTVGVLCPECAEPMTPLFTSMVCERCDAEAREVFVGWIVWRSRPPGSQEYVFRRPADAKKWRRAQGLGDFPIRRISTESQTRWRQSGGSLKELELADRLFEIYPDVRYPPGENRAHLA